jgi:Ca-activated chloride channel family protein
MRIIPIILVFSVSCVGGGINRKNKEGAELYREGKLDEALAAFTQAQVESPDAAEIHYNIGNVHYRKEEMDKAVEEYRAALKGGVDVQQPAHYNTGNVHYRGQDMPGAIEAYKQALKINPDDIEARQNLELALKQQEEQEQQGGGGGGESDEDDEQESDPSSQQEQEDQQEREQEQQQQSQQDQREMSKEEAERLLAALAEMEKAEQRRQQQKQQIKVRGKKKDW